MTTTFRVDFDRITRFIITDVTVRRATVNGVVYDAAPIDLPVRALWDTGAGRSVISASLVEKLSLSAADAKTMYGIGCMVTSNLYDISLALPSKLVFPVIRAAEWDGCRDYDMLVGMDIISQGRFVIDNAADKTVFTFAA